MTMKQSKKFFVPGNISCIFVICPDKNPSIVGSLGLGFTINKGVTVSVQRAEKKEIFWNGKSIDLPTVNWVVQHLAKEYSVRVFLSSNLPLGCGFGLSGAAALATTYALNDLFNLKKTKLQLAKIVHIAEVENGTGLGDVVNEYYKGFLLKTVPSSEFKVQKIPITGIPVYYKYFSKLPTKDILADTKRFKQINAAGKKAIEEVQSLLKYVIDANGMENNNWIPDQVGDDKVKEVFAKIIGISKNFAEESGLLTDQRVKKTIKEIELRGGHASMILLGNAVFSDIPFEGAMELKIC